ncbi:response regulator [Fluviibacter phosphoraccumulans]|uniref:Response regulator n=1 Tax=Fluviibacter phosphoraccumulans TaxID=1751046 RepID=A0A679IDN1_9RHOO|nr:response regulator [Fluviibacter phosphoraccumulans]BBU68399.1 response regulator [Fluviibacter phosphoraccumulans]BBU72446.1 response regulator [Fluviibacter phosphoraccumulans]BCA66582.1 response regulator [Fluviibacter phosphoraccumulans]
MTIQTILVVEPSPIERAQLSSILTTAGYTVTVAGDGEEAVEIARREGPDLILMEVVMPGLNGYQATRALTRSEDESLARIPVILISAKGQDTDKVWGLRQGAIDYLVKPVTEHELLTRIADI